MTTTKSDSWNEAKQIANLVLNCVVSLLLALLYLAIYILLQSGLRLAIAFSQRFFHTTELTGADWIVVLGLQILFAFGILTAFGWHLYRRVTAIYGMTHHDNA